VLLIEVEERELWIGETERHGQNKVLQKYSRITTSRKETYGIKQ
jgi:hypothetical protein